MCASIHRTGDPYELAGKRMAFVDWRWIQPGRFAWDDGNGKPTTLKGLEGPWDADLRREDVPQGIRLVQRQAERSGPVFPTERDWEQGGIYLSSILHDQGKYRAWGSTTWGSSLPDKVESHLVYYESDDGMTWRRPDFAQVEFNGNRSNNLLHGPRFGGQVFVDPTSVGERYKMFAEARIPHDKCRQFIADYPNDVENIALTKDYAVYGMLGAVSPDGFNWTVLEQPLSLSVADTQMVGCYDAQLQKYVVYSREWVCGPQARSAVSDEIGRLRWSKIGRRAINRSESADFRHFPLPELVIEPDPSMPPYDVLYMNCYTVYPGAPEHKLMFPTVWRAGFGDDTYFLLYSSHDGKRWHKLSNEPLLDTAPFGRWDGGCIFAQPNLLELPGGDFALPYTGWDVPHKYPRMNAARNVGYAVWRKGRLVGVEAPDRGEFATVAFIPSGSRMRVNAVTARGGYVRVEAARMDGVPIEGRTFDDCNPIIGDAYRQTVVWGDRDHFGLAEGEPLMLRIRMDRATLYSFDFE